MPDNPSVFDDRETEEYLAHSHNERIETLGDWKDRIERARELIRGQVAYKNPDGVVVSSELQITNLADQVPRDTARLVSEVEPSYRAPIKGKGDSADLNAEVRGLIARNYFEMNRFDIIRPYLSMDLDVAGACFVCAWVDPAMSVPRFERIDPQFAYPDIHNGRLVDLLVIQQLKLRTARLLFPAENFDDIFSNANETDDVTIMDYYGPKFNSRALGRAGSEGGKMDSANVHLINYWEHGCDRIPVGFAMLPSPTGEFHGSLDQIGPAMSTKNRLVNLITEYAHEGIYAPWEERGILNWNEDPGPDTRYHHNPNLDGDTFMRRLAPASFNGELFSLLQFLETEQRGQMGYPAARQGDVTQSIVSNAGIMGMQGQLQSIVKERMRLLTQVQSNLAAVAFQLDQKEIEYAGKKFTLDFEKPLPALVGNKRAYLPSRDIGDKYDVRVMYGAGAGLDRLNADQRLINYKTIGVLSGETMLEQSDFIEDARGEMQRVQDEEIERILLQKWLSSPEVTPDIIGMTLKIKDDRGISLSMAWAEVQSQLAEQMAAAQAAALPPEEAAAGAPAGPTGAPAAAPAPQPEFARTPLHQVIS